MKIIIKVFYLLIFVLGWNSGFAQKPTYNLKATNFENVAPNIIDFDIYLEHTNPPEPFNFFGAQFGINIDSTIANGGTLSCTIAPAKTGDSSDLPMDMRCKPPSIEIYTDRVKFIAAATKISTAPKGLDLTGKTDPGIKIVRLRLETSSDSFANMPLILKWRTETGMNTMVAAYTGEKISDITTPETHFIIMEKK